MTTYRSKVGILHKHAASNWFDETYADFEGRLERGLIPHVAIPGWFLVRTYCTSCDEEATAIRYRGRRILLVPSGTTQMGKFWVIHQCPPPCDERAALHDDQQYDGDGNPV